MNIKIEKQNQATRLTIRGKKGWKIPMARFQSGIFVYDSEKIDVRTSPVGWRAYFPYGKWSPPYLEGSRVEFVVELVDTTTRLFNLPFYVLNTISKNYERIPIDSKAQEAKKTFDWYSAPHAGTLQVWLGEPEKPGSINIVNADTFNFTNVAVAVFTALAVLVASGLCRWVVGLISQ